VVPLVAAAGRVERIAELLLRERLDREREPGREERGELLLGDRRRLAVLLADDEVLQRRPEVPPERALLLGKRRKGRGGTRARGPAPLLVRLVAVRIGLEREMLLGLGPGDGEDGR